MKIVGSYVALCRRVGSVKYSITTWLVGAVWLAYAFVGGLQNVGNPFPALLQDPFFVALLILMNFLFVSEFFRDIRKKGYRNDA